MASCDKDQMADPPEGVRVPLGANVGKEITGVKLEDVVNSWLRALADRQGESGQDSLNGVCPTRLRPL